MFKGEGLTKRFGGLIAVNDVSLNVNAGEVLGLIGPNGSGKTTLLNLISGIYSYDSGEAYFNGSSLRKLKPHEITRKGIGRTFQVTRLFRRLSVMENMLSAGLATQNNTDRSALTEEADNWLGLVGLHSLRDEQAGNLSGGQQRLLEFTRALMLRPQLMLLDEPFGGVHPVVMEKIKELINKLKAEGKAVIIISHDIQSVFELSDRMMVLNEGKTIAEGTPKKVRTNDKVVRAYLGV